MTTAPRPIRQPRELPRRRYRIALSGDLDGFTITMGAMRGRELVRMRRGEMDEADVIDLIAERCIEHDLPVPDLHDLDSWAYELILAAWGDALTETALPPANGEPSPAASGASPQAPVRP